MLFFIIILSAIAGSFFNSLIYRLNSGVGLFKPPYSICPKCKQRLTSLDLIPILSFVLLRGTCRHCGKPIPLRYFFLETTCVAVGIVGYFLHVSVAALAMHLVFVAILFSDLFYQEIPYTLSGLALLTIVAQPLSPEWYLNFAVIAVFWLSVLALERWYYRREVFGGADILLFGFGGLLFSFPQFLLFFYATFFIGLLVAGVLIVVYKFSLKQTIPFGPFILIALWLVLFFGRSFLLWYRGLWHV